MTSGKSRFEELFEDKYIQHETIGEITLNNKKVTEEIDRHQLLYNFKFMNS